MAMNNIRVVLVHTSHPGNIGGVARAMKNMGLTRLTLVKPKAFPAPEALWRAASAEDVLVNATVVETVEEAVKGAQFIVGTSARERRIPWPLRTFTVACFYRGAPWPSNLTPFAAINGENLCFTSDGIHPRDLLHAIFLTRTQSRVT